MGFWIFLGILALVALAGVSLYNRLVGLRNAAESAWSDVDVQLKRRWDLVPNLVETVKGYASHEQSTFTKVTEMRSQAMAETDPAAKANAENGLTRALRSMFAVAEGYPELKASQNFRDLQADLTKVEDAIQNARRYFNAIVRDLNTSCETFPSNLIANNFGFAKRDYFELDDEAERSAPAVSF
ncbi:MAG: LemA family protein [Deltaproteobacteria bacterium]|nr:LemA family protein [Deltaproteobacteria bacterium]MBW2444874.1 LemA family protein [Deltaproteobacteria bacterium]